MAVSPRSALLALVVMLCANACRAASVPAGIPSAPSTITPSSRVEPVAGPVLADPVYTPGATNADVSQATISATICRYGWTATVRPPESYTEDIKHLEARAGGSITYQGITYPVQGFGLTDPTISHYELDHLIPLELGGSPADPRNLWMEPYELPRGSAAPGTGSQTKDHVEDAARAAVCGGRLPLADAQREMAADWYTLGQRLGVIGR